MNNAFSADLRSNDEKAFLWCLELWDNSTDKEEALNGVFSLFEKALAKKDSTQYIQSITEYCSIKKDFTILKNIINDKRFNKELQSVLLIFFATLEASKNMSSARYYCWDNIKPLINPLIEKTTLEEVIDNAKGNFQYSSSIFGYLINKDFPYKDIVEKDIVTEKRKFDCLLQLLAIDALVGLFRETKKEVIMPESFKKLLDILPKDKIDKGIPQIYSLALEQKIQKSVSEIKNNKPENLKAKIKTI